LETNRPIDEKAGERRNRVPYLMELEKRCHYINEQAMERRIGFHMCCDWRQNVLLFVNKLWKGGVDSSIGRNVVQMMNRLWKGRVELKSVSNY
jgi:hypothetical protein